MKARWAMVIVVAALAMPSLAIASTVRPVHLPADHGAHPSFSVEWWYTAGTVTDRRGDPFFWFATIWSGGPGQVARVNVVDLRHDRVVLAQQYLLLRHPAAGQHAWSISGYRLAYRPSGPRGVWSIDAPTRAGRLRLTLTPAQPYLLHGRAGVIRQGPGGLSAYYSAPRLTARGSLALGSTRLSLTGQGWLDHQWGNFISDPGAIRWNWFACQFRDGRDLMLYQFLDRRDRPSGVLAGTLMTASGRVLHLHAFTAAGRPPIIKPSGAQASYPLRWRVRVPGAHLSLSLRARARHQFVPMQILPSFWESADAITSGPRGACIVESSRETAHL